MRIFLKDLTPGTQYLLQARATNGAVQSPWSHLVSLTTTTDTLAPKAVSGLAVSAVGTSFVATWNRPTQNSDNSALSDLSYYRVTVTANSISRTYHVTQERFDLPLEVNRAAFGTPQAAVSIAVVPVDMSGNLGNSASASATNAAPAQITGVTASPGSDGIVVSWNPSSDTDVALYRIYRGATNVRANAALAGETQGTTFTYSTSNTAVDNYFWVYAVDVFNNGSPDSAVVGPVRPKNYFASDTTAPAVPATLTVTAAYDSTAMNSYIDATWAAVSDTALGGYKLSYSVGNTTNWEYIDVPSDVTTYRLTYLPPNVSVYVRVAAYDFAANRSAVRNAATYPITTAKDATVPATVTGLASTTGPSSVTLTWTEATEEDVKDGRGYYLVDYSTSSTFASGITTVKSTYPIATITGLTGGTTYYFRIKAVDSSANQSAAFSATHSRVVGSALTELDLEIGGVNLVGNSNMASATPFYGARAPAQQTLLIVEDTEMSAVLGTNALQITATVANADLGATPQSPRTPFTSTQKLAASVYAKQTAGTTPAGMRVGIDYYDAGGTYVGGDYTNAITLTSTLQRLTITSRAAPPATVAFAQVMTYSGAFSAADTVVRLKGFQLERGDFVTGYAPAPVEVQVNTKTAQTTADLAELIAEAGVNGTAINVNPMFIEWTGTIPVNWVQWSTLVPSKETALARTINAVRFNATAATDSGGIQGTAATALKNLPLGLEYVTVEVDVMLVSGTSFNGSGVILDWTGMTNARQNLRFDNAVSTPVTGKWYRISTVLRRSTASTGTQTSWDTWLMANYPNNSLGTGAAKDILFDRVSYRPSSTEEVLAFNAATAASVTALTTVVGTKVATFNQATAPAEDAARVTGDLWYDTDDGNRLYRYVSTNTAGNRWVSHQMGNSALADASINGVKLIASTVTAEKLSIGSFNETIIPNGSFEDLQLQTGNTNTPAGMPSRWIYDLSTGHVGATYAVETSLVRSGQRAVSMTNAANAAAQIYNVDLLPVAAGEKVYLAAHVSSAVATTGSAVQLRAYYYTGQTYVSQTTIMASDVTTANVFRRFEGTVTIPAAITGVRLVVVLTTNAASRTIVVDAAEVRRLVIGTQIDNDTITTSHIVTTGLNAQVITTGTMLGDRIQTNTLDAATLKANTAFTNALTVASTFTLGTSAGGAGSIKSFDYTGTGGTTGFQLNSNSLDIRSGTIAARALQIQEGANLLPAHIADFEFNPTYYTGKITTSNSTFSIVSTAGEAKYNAQALRWVGSNPAVQKILSFGPSFDGLTMPVEAGETYIWSLWVKNNLAAARIFRITARTNLGTFPGFGPTTIQPGATHTRVQGATTFAAGVTSVTLYAEVSAADNVDIDFTIDGMQFEKRLGSISTPSPWRPPGLTTIDGGIIRTGEIRSRDNNATGEGESAQPVWSINTAGNATFTDAHVRGRLIVGNALATTAEQASTSVRSHNYSATLLTGWAIAGNGDVDFNNGKFRGVVTATSGTFTGQVSIETGGMFRAGPLLGTHVEMTSAGFYVYAEDLVDGVPNEVIRMGTDTNDFFSVTNLNGVPVASIDSEGHSSFTGLSVEEDPEIQGTLLSKRLSTAPQGIVALVEHAYLELGNYLPPSTTGEQAYFDMAAEIMPDRMYRIVAPDQVVRAGANGDTIQINIRGAKNATPTLASTRYAFDNRTVATAGGAAPLAVESRVFPGNMWVTDQDVIDGTNIMRFLLTIQRIGGTGSVLWHDPAGSYPVSMYVEDAGPLPIGLAVKNTSSINGATTVTQAPTATKKQYISTWNASSSATYKGDGSRRTDTTDIVQGQSPGGGSGNGIQEAVVLFAAGAVAGETSKSLATALTGATVTKVEVYLYANHWYNNAGGTARITTHNYYMGGFPASSPAHIHRIDSGRWPKPGGRWVTLPSGLNSSWASGAIRGFGVGFASTDLTYYGRFNGAGQAYRPQLRITYTR